MYIYIIRTLSLFLKLLSSHDLHGVPKEGVLHQLNQPYPGIVHAERGSFRNQHILRNTSSLSDQTHTSSNVPGMKSLMSGRVSETGWVGHPK